MSYPGEGVEGMYRNDIQQVAAYLDHKHRDHYMIFNLSERNYNFDLFHRRVVDYGWPDHHGPPLLMLIKVVTAMDRWMRADSKNVAIVHCLAGRGRTGTAICAYLCYAGYFASMTKALQYYSNVRSNKGKGVTQPSQLRYCKYIDLILNRGLTPQPKCVSITRLTLTPVPSMTSQLGIRPVLNIYRYAPGVQELIWTSLKDGTEPPFFGPREGEISFDISDMPPITGDVMIKMSHASSWMWLGSKMEIVLRLILNTSFLADGSNVLTLTKRDLDITHKDQRFPLNTQLFLYTSVIPDAPAPPKSDWDPDAYNEWIFAAKEHRAKLITDLSDSASSSEKSAENSSSSPQLLRDDPRTISFSPFHEPRASSDSPIPSRHSLEAAHAASSSAPVSLEHIPANNDDSIPQEVPSHEARQESTTVVQETEANDQQDLILEPSDPILEAPITAGEEEDVPKTILLEESPLQVDIEAQEEQIIETLLSSPALSSDLDESPQSL